MVLESGFPCSCAWEHLGLSCITGKHRGRVVKLLLLRIQFRPTLPRPERQHGMEIKTQAPVSLMVYTGYSGGQCEVFLFVVENFNFHFSTVRHFGAEGFKWNSIGLMQKLHVCKYSAVSLNPVWFTMENTDMMFFTWTWLHTDQRQRRPWN